MRTSKFTPEQMVHILRQGESGVPIGELCRQHQISYQARQHPAAVPSCPRAPNGSHPKSPEERSSSRLVGLVGVGDLLLTKRLEGFLAGSCEFG